MTNPAPVRRMEWPEIQRQAKQIPRIPTNPATYEAAGILRQLMQEERYCNHD